MKINNQIRKREIDLEAFTPAKGAKHVVFKTRTYKKVETDKVSGTKFISERKSYGYPIGRAVLVDPDTYNDVVKKYKIAEDYDPNDPRHGAPRKEHNLDELKRIGIEQEKKKATTTSTTSAKK